MIIIQSKEIGYFSVEIVLLCVCVCVRKTNGYRMQKSTNKNVCPTISILIISRFSLKLYICVYTKRMVTKCRLRTFKHLLYIICIGH